MQIGNGTLCMGCRLKNRPFVVVQDLELSAAAHNAKEGGRTAGNPRGSSFRERDLLSIILCRTFAVVLTSRGINNVEC
ncbi:hypothetical protein [Ochrobactrum sp. A-1]|uniref:hypothetical protein n=1 Tax=Ochrobactrum sp. A-1 TaxID=2920940 RepID=UPI001F0B6F9D